MAGDRNPLDPRGQLYKEYLAVVAMVRPRMFVMENVKGLTSMKVLPEPLDDETRKKVEMIQRHRDLKRCRAQRSLDEQEEEEFQKLEKRQVALKREIKGKLVDLLPRIMKEIKELGYVVDWRVLNAVDHGSPQSRQRVFIVARREDLDLEFSFPEPIPEEDRMTVKEAIGHLESVRDGEVSNHDFTRHSNDMRDRLSRLPQGQNLYPRFRDSWWRLMPDQPSRTVKENHGGVFIHYDQPRALTPRELACLQDFPDDFAFAGCKSKVLVQVGNAVPVKLARAVARSARVTLETRK